MKKKVYIVFLAFIFILSCTNHLNKLHGYYGRLGDYYYIVDDSLLVNKINGYSFSNHTRGYTRYINNKYSVIEFFKYPYLDQVLICRADKNSIVISNSNLSMNKVQIDSVFIYENNIDGYKTNSDTIYLSEHRLDSLTVIMYPKYFNNKDSTIVYKFDINELKTYSIKDTFNYTFLLEFYDNGEDKSPTIIEKICKNKIAFISKDNSYHIVYYYKALFRKKNTWQTISYDSIYNRPLS